MVSGAKMKWDGGGGVGAGRNGKVEGRRGGEVQISV